MRFIQWCKERYSAILKATPFHKKKKIAKEMEVEILDGGISSRYEEIHGTNGTDGLCDIIVEVFDAMVELRMRGDYGDYLVDYHTSTALKGDDTRTALKGENMNDMKWKVDKMDWQAVAEEVKKEEARLAEEKRR